MSEQLAKYVKAQEKARKPDRPQEDELPRAEKRALQKMQQEAKEIGSQLTTGGKGGLPPSLVLGVMRRDGYRCKKCGELGDMEKNGGLGVHHKGGIPESKWLSKKGHANDPNNLVSICHDCHDDVHEEARENGTDSEQVKPEGDKAKGDE